MTPGLLASGRAQRKRPTRARVHLSARRMLLLGFAALAVLLCGLGGWAALTTISGAVVATGKVEVDRNRQIVQHPDGGVVAEILAHDGDRVVAGQVLLRLDGSLLRPELAIVEGQRHEILARRGRLEAERADADEIHFADELLAVASRDEGVKEQVLGQTRLFAARRETLQKSLDQIGRRLSQTWAQIDGIDAQTAALTTQQGLIARELEGQQSLLERGLTQSGRVLALEREAAGLAGQIGALAADRAQAAGRITELELERLRMTSQRREDAETELRDIGYRELELAERRRVLSGQIDRLELRAPAPGLVYALTVSTPQAVIRPAEPVLYVVPSDRPLVIEARISPLNVDQVRPGQPVTLRFPGLAGRTSPDVEGSVTRISADAFTDEATQASYYKVEVTPDAAETERLSAALMPGMPAEVFLRTSERTPLAYLLKPFTTYFSRAFRED